MRHSSSTLEALHRLSSRNRDSVQGSRQCGCFHCLRTFEASAIEDWVPESDGGEVTALCPFCGIDSVLPARKGAPVDADILKAMHAYWFGHPVTLPAEPSLMGTLRMRVDPLLRRLKWDLFGASLCAMLLSTATALPAQGIISGRALLQNSTRPLACADAALRRSDGTIVATTFIREDGTFEFAAPAAGRYVVAFSTLGMVDAVATFDSLHPGSDVDRTFTVPLIPVDSLVERVSAARGDKRYARLARTSAAPRYPAAERTGGREGGVVAAVVVSADGRVDTVLTSILYASAEPFEASVRESFAQMRFEPAEVEGQARCSLLVLPYIFDLGANAAPLPVEQRGPCPPVPPPSAEDPPVYLLCQVDRPAREVRNTAALHWSPPGDINSNSCFRAEVRFVVDTLGVPERATLSLVSTNDGGYGRAVLAMAPDLRFSPARLKGRPVRQILSHRESVGIVRVTTVDGGSRVGSATPSRASRC